MLNTPSSYNFQRLAGTAVVAVGTIVLMGWMFDISVLKSILPDLPNMKANAAVGMILLGSSIITTVYQNKKYSVPSLPMWLTLPVLVLGLLTLSQYLFSCDLGIDQLLFRDSPDSVLTAHPGRMSPFTAISFLLLSSSIILIQSGRPLLAHRLALLSIPLLMIPMGGYLFGDPNFPYIGNFTITAPQTALIFFVASSAIMSMTWEYRCFTSMTIDRHTITFYIAMALLLLCGLATYLNTKRLINNDTSVEHSYQVVLTLDDIDSDISGLAASVRGYLITGLKDFISGVEHDRKDFVDDFGRLQQLTEDNPVQQKLLQQIKPLLDLRLNLLDKTLTQYRDSGFNSSKTLEKVQSAEKLSHQLRDLFHEIRQAEQKLLQQRQNKSQQSAHSVIASLFIAGSAGLALMLMVLMGLRRQITERKQMESELRDSELFYRTILDSTPDAMLISDAAGIITLVNNHVEHLLGYKPVELIGQPVDFLVPEEVRKKHRVMVADYIVSHGANAAIVSRPLRALMKNGSILHVEVSICPVPTERGLFVATSLRDITERKKVENRMRVAAAAFETPHEAIVVTDSHANIIQVNQAFEHITGYSQEEVVGKNTRILKSGRHEDAFYAEMWQSLLTKGSWKGELWDRRKGGKIYPKQLSITAVRDAGGNTIQYVAAFHDISARKRAEEEMHSLAFYDALTGLPNRRLLHERLDLAVSVSARNKKYGALFYLDMDKFKTLNDTQGHEAGDTLLVEVAARMKLCVREVDTLARFGGDEFVVLVEEIGTEEADATQHAAIIAEKIRAVLATPYIINDREFHTSPSIGVCLFLGSGTPVDELLKRADIAMYQAKDSGRNQVRFFDPQLQLSVDSRAALESAMREAITCQQFRLYYQIQVDRDHRPIGAEALIRWESPTHGTVSPIEFIPLAEETTLILDIGNWVLDTACQQIAAWSNNPLTSDLVIAVNISARQFRQSDFVQLVDAAITKHQILPSRLKLELTESVALDNLEGVIAKMTALRENLGVTISLDDFGTGYSSLSYLKRLPLDQIKIDQSFVRDINTDPNDAVMVQTIIEMAHNFGLHVIAEGVETVAHMDFLKQRGCMAYQGYLFSKPVPHYDFELLLNHHLTLKGRIL